MVCVLFLSSRVNSTRQSAKALCGSSHFASKAEPSSLGLATSKNIRRRRNSPTLFPFLHELLQTFTVFLCKITTLAVKQNSAFRCLQRNTFSHGSPKKEHTKYAGYHKEVYGIGVMGRKDG